MQTAYVICQRSPKGSGAKGHSADTSRAVSSHTLTSGHISEPPHHLLLSPTQRIFSHRLKCRPRRLKGFFPMEGALPAWGSCVNSSPLNPTGLPRHSCSLKPKQTLAGIIKRCAWKAKISYSIKGLKSHFQPCLIT